MLRGIFRDRFEDLLAAWHRHQQLRAAGTASVAELAESRFHLDQLRDRANRTRRAFAPEPRELQSVLLTTFCSTFDETVFLFHTDADWSASEPRFRCACGSTIEGAVHPA